MNVTRPYIYAIASSLAVALLFGAVIGQVGWSLFITTVAWLGWHSYSAWQFTGWMKHTLSRPAMADPLWQDLADGIYRSNQRGRRRNRLLLNQLQRLQTVTQAIPDAAIVLGPHGEIERFNQAAVNHLRLSAADRGKNLAALVRAPELASLLRGSVPDELLEFGSPFDDGKRLEARRITIAPDQHLLLVRDISELNRLLSMRQDFVANVSHELRTPLTVIMGYLETLQDEDFPASNEPDSVHTLAADEIRMILGKLNAPTHRMKALVDDLLLLTRLESNPPPSLEQLVPIDMRSLVHQIVEEAKALSSANHEFVETIDSSTRLIGSEQEVHSALANLVVNAVRYSPAGGAIRISWNRQDDGVQFEVCDSGVGIAPEHLSRLTERFYRVDLAGSRVRGGTGLGLAIVKHVLKRHDSVLQIESQLGRGSRFYCNFPKQRVDRVPAQAEA